MHRNILNLAAPKWMGIDEIHIIKRPRAVISNLDNNTAVNLLPNRYKTTIATYLASLKGREDVRYVAIDMWEPYKDAVHAVLPNAIVVVDKFHVQRMGNKAFDEFRRSLSRRDAALAYFDHRITNAFTESLNSLIRVMNRLGRGYSFEALRAKILFSKGSHKTVLEKPAFQRQASFDPCYAHFEAADRDDLKSQATPDTLNYGVDIDKLVAMIEAGEI